MRLRRAVAGDAPAIGAIFDAAVRAGWTYLGDLAAKPMFSSEDWERLVADHEAPNVLLVAAEAGIPVQEYAPLEVKMAITGIGNAEKDRVRAMMIRAHRVEGVPEQPDAADAAAVALCHLHQSRVRRAAAAAGAP